MKGWKMIFIFTIILFFSACGGKSENESGGEIVPGGRAPETFLIDAPEPVTHITTAVFTFRSDITEVIFKCNLDGGGWTSCVSPFIADGLHLGGHRFQVKAVDIYGREDTTPEEWKWYILAPVETDYGNAEEVYAGVFSSNTISTGFYEGGRLECSLDGGGWEECGDRYSVENLEEGEHILYVRKVDERGNVTRLKRIIFTIDRTPPEVYITRFPDSPTPLTEAELHITASDNSDEEVSFECFLDGNEVDGCESVVMVSGLSDGEHQFCVRGIDAGGNRSEMVCAHWVVDTVPPEVFFTGVPPSVSDSPYATFSFSSTGAVTFYCKVDDGVWFQCRGEARTGFLENGTHHFYLYGVDEAGNRSSTTVYGWLVRHIPPETFISSHPPAHTASRGGVFHFHSDVMDAKFRCRIDGGKWFICTSPARFTNLGESQHTFEVVAVDRYGYEDSTPASYTWVVDVTPPDASFTSTPHNPTDFKYFTFEFSASDNISSTLSYQCRVDDGNWFTCSSPYSFSTGNGNHTFYLKVEDEAGNVTQIDYSWRVFSWIDVSAGGYVTCGIRDDHSLWCWGNNSHYQLGTGDTTEYHIPHRVNTASWKQVSVGGTFFFLTHVCAVSTTGNLDCWGYNAYGQVGNGGTNDVDHPVWIMGSVDKVSAGGYHTCAIKMDGSLYCWGYNAHGQVGDGTTTDRHEPEYIGSDWSDISAGGFHTCGIKSSDSGMYCWGANDQGQIGDDTTTDRHSPVKITNYAWVGVSAGGSHSCGIRFYLLPTPGTELWCWGDNSYGQIGDGTTTDRHSPKGIANGYDTVELGTFSSFGKKSSFYGWGYNGHGELGLGDTNHRHYPVEMSSSWEKISAGFYHTCGIQTDGSLWCWGFNGSGQLGDGTTTERHSPVHVYPTPWP